MTATHINSSAQLDELFKSTTYVAVDFFADWCPPCKQIAPIYESLAKRHSLPQTMAFAKVNVDHVGDVAQKYQITAMPTFMFFKDGKQVAVNGDKMIRGADPQKLNSAVDKVAGLAKKKFDAAASA